ncbi:MAG: cyclic-phosphate processing receiver domain-containing protein [bacterium]
MKVFLDDKRLTPMGWVSAKSPDKVIELLKTGEVTELSLDYDLGENTWGTGYDVIIWLEQQVINNNFKLPSKITIHSDHVLLKPRMESAIKNIINLAQNK